MWTESSGRAMRLGTKSKANSQRAAAILFFFAANHWMVVLENPGIRLVEGKSFQIPKDCKALERFAFLEQGGSDR